MTGEMLDPADERLLEAWIDGSADPDDVRRRRSTSVAFARELAALEALEGRLDALGDDLRGAVLADLPAAAADAWTASEEERSRVRAWLAAEPLPAAGGAPPQRIAQRGDPTSTGLGWIAAAAALLVAVGLGWYALGGAKRTEAPVYLGSEPEFFAPRLEGDGSWHLSWGFPLAADGWYEASLIDPEGGAVLLGPRRLSEGRWVLLAEERRALPAAVELEVRVRSSGAVRLGSGRMELAVPGP